MNQSRLKAFPFLQPSTKKNPRLHTAVLLNPAEVDVAFKDYPAEARLEVCGRWMLIGAVHPATYSAFKANAGGDITADMTVFPTPSGAVAALLSCQFGARQHRFVLPLFEPKVMEMLAAATQGALNIYLECAGELAEGMLYGCPLPPEFRLPARAMCRQIDVQKRSDFTAELPSIILEALTLELVPSLNAAEVSDVDVSILLPQSGMAER